MRLRKLLPVYFIVFAILIGIVIWGDRAVETMTNEAILLNRTTVVIDAGHGGVDGGAVSCTGIFESKINLEISLRLNALMQFLGYDTVMIRTTDISVYTSGNTIAEKKISDLRERVRIINSTENCLLVSIHQNMFQESKYSGAQVFYADSKDSKILAESLQQSFLSTVNPGSSRKAKKSSGVYLMEHVQCTAILVECGFLSNPEEENKLRQAQYQKELCCVIAASCSSFISNT